MARERGRTTWVKLYCYGRLHGSMNYQLTEAEQSIWDKFLCMAGLCGMGGLIADNDKHPLPHEFIAHEFHAPLDLLESTLTKCKKEGRLSEDGDGIRVTNWTIYQGEYDRQKVSRDKKKGELTEEQQEAIKKQNDRRQKFLSEKDK